MTFTRTRLIQTLLATGALAASLGAYAQSWPDKAVKFIVPLPPGGPFDVYDAVAQEFVVRGAHAARVAVPPDAAAVFVAVPAGAPLVRDVENTWLLAGGVVIDWQLVPRA